MIRQNVVTGEAAAGRGVGRMSPRAWGTPYIAGLTALRTIVSAALVCTVSQAPAFAQQQDSGPLTSPTVSMVDQNHINLGSGLTAFPIKLFSLGSGDLGLSLTVNYHDPASVSTLTNNNSLQGYIEPTFTPGITTSYYYIGLKGDTVVNNTDTTSTDGGIVAYNANGTKTFTDRNGTVMQLTNNYATSVSYANGKTLRYQGQVGLYATSAWSVLQNNGLLVKRYANGNYVIVNLAYEYCDPNPAITCSLTQSWPTANETSVTNADGTHTLTVTDASGGSYQISTGAGADASAIISYHDKSWSPGTVISYWRCSRAKPDCYYYNSSTGTQTNLYDRVQTATKNGITWKFNYVWSVGPNGYVYEQTAPYTKSFYGVALWNKGYPYDYTNEVGTYYFDDSVDGRVESDPYGNKYSYDVRGNLTDILEYANGSIYATIHGDYDASCTYPAKCNKANDVIDANGNRTDYAYDNSTGLILNEQLSAVNGIRPVKRYSYVQRSAWYLNSSGAYVKDASPIWLLNTEKTCRTGATNIAADTCSISGDEVVTTYDYGPDSGPNNLWLRGISVTAGGVTHRTCYGYDRLGNRISETTPNANLTSCP